MREKTCNPEDIYTGLRNLGIRFVVHEHEPVMTVAESKAVRGRLEGALCKCLFLKSKREAFYLLAVPADMQVDLKKLAATLQCGRLSFASPDELYDILGLTPGAVSLLGAVNDLQGRAAVIMERSLAAYQGMVHFHPLVNTATVGILPEDLVRFLRHLNHPPVMVDGIER